MVIILQLLSYRQMDVRKADHSLGLPSPSSPSYSPSPFLPLLLPALALSGLVNLLSGGHMVSSLISSRRSDVYTSPPSSLASIPPLPAKSAWLKEAAVALEEERQEWEERGHREWLEREQEEGGKRGHREWLEREQEKGAEREEGEYLEKGEWGEKDSEEENEWGKWGREEEEWERWGEEERFQDLYTQDIYYTRPRSL